jgi:membrane protease YdiL (CAAX protease family)
MIFISAFIAGKGSAMRIIKPKFLQAALTKPGHNLFMEFLIAGLLFVIGEFVMSCFESPFLMDYFMKNTDYKSLLSGGSFDMSAIASSMKDLPEWFNFVFLSAEILLVFVCMIYCRSFEKRPLYSMGFTGRRIGTYVSLGALAGFMIPALYVLVACLSESASFTGFSSDFNPGFFAAYLGAYLIQGFAEETFTRGYFFVSLTKRYSVLASAVSSSLIIAMFQQGGTGISIMSFINAVLFGTMMALIFVKTESIWFCAVLHGVWNFTESCIFGLSTEGLLDKNSLFVTDLYTDSLTEKLLSGGSVGAVGSLFTTFVLLVVIVLVLFSMKKQGIAIKDTPEAAKEEVEFNKYMTSQYKTRQQRQFEEFARQMTDISRADEEKRKGSADNVRQEPTPRDFIRKAMGKYEDNAGNTANMKNSDQLPSDGGVVYDKHNTIFGSSFFDDVRGPEGYGNVSEAGVGSEEPEEAEKRADVLSKTSDDKGTEQD